MRTNLSRFSRLAASSIATLAMLALVNQPVSAQNLQLARAEEWFKVGKEKLARQDYEGACAALTESVELDRASGALLALALCHEHTRKYATAFREYNEVASRSQLEQRSDRQVAARKKASSLEWKLSTLSVTAPAETPELTVRINGVAVETNQLGTPLPIDGGTVSIEASAPNRVPWSTEVVVGSSSDRKTVAIPELESITPVARPVPIAPLAPPPPSAAKLELHDSAPESTGLSGTRVAGIITMGAAVAGALTGGILVFHAIGKNNDSKANCLEDLCTLDGKRDRLFARDAGNAATIAFIATGALGAAGLVLYIAGGRGHSAETQDHSALTTSLWAAPGAAGASMRGRF